MNEDRSELNARLRELAVITPFSLDEWVAAAMWLGDHAEAALPAVEAMCATGLWRPENAANSMQWALDPSADRPTSADPRS